MKILSILLVCIVLDVYGEDAQAVAWIPVSDGALPQDALVAGHDNQNTTVRKLYICRANTTTGAGNSGYFIPEVGGCIFASKKTCHTNHTYDVLTVQPSVTLHWVGAYTGGEIPPNAVTDGHGNYVGRSEHSGGMYAGSIPPGLKVNLFCARDQYQWKNSYDVLTYTSRHANLVSYNITNVTYDLDGIKVTNESDRMVVASDVTTILDDYPLHVMAIYNAEARITLPYEHRVVRHWNVTSYSMVPGVPVMINTGVAGMTVSGNFSITAKDKRFLQTPEIEEIQSTPMNKEVTLFLGTVTQGPSLGDKLLSTQVVLSAQARLVSIPFEATMRYFTGDGSSSDPITIHGEYLDLQNYDVETSIRDKESYD